MNDTEKFYCYSIQLKNFLKLKGINYIYRSRHHKSGNLFWVFKSSLALDQALEDWEQYKKIFWKEKKC